MTRRLALALLAVLASSAANAAEPMSIVDFLVDQNDLVGQTVTLEECQVVNAITSFLACKGDDGGQLLFASWPKGDKENMRRAMKTCANNFGDSPACRVTITGTAKKAGAITFQLTKIEWASEAVTPRKKICE